MAPCPAQLVAEQAPSRGSPITRPPRQGRFVLHPAAGSHGEPGASKRPLLAATATRTGVTAPNNPAAPKRDLIAAVAVATAASASRHGQPNLSGIRTSTPRSPPPDKPRPHRLQPPAARRNQPRTVAAGTRLTPIRRCPTHRRGQQRGPNPLRRIRSAQQHGHWQQHVRRPTTAAPSPPRTKRIRQPVDPSRTSMTPSGQHPITTTRAPDLPGRQPGLDADRIDLYRHHRCLRALQRGTAPARQDFTGCRAPISSSSH